MTNPSTTAATRLDQIAADLDQLAGEGLVATAEQANRISRALEALVENAALTGGKLPRDAEDYVVMEATPHRGV
jgi:aspartate aminotransferase-like enzyme